MNERLKVMLWCLVHYPEYKFKSWLTRKSKTRLKIYTSEQSLSHILEHQCSVARFGDGELQMISHYIASGTQSNFDVDTFQSYDSNLAKRLYDTLIIPQPNLLVCLPHQLIRPQISNLYGELFWEREWLARKDFLSAHCLDRQLGDTNFTRFYMGRHDITDYPRYIAMMKQVWAGRNVLMIEGELSRLGVGNDLFDSAKSIRRILCPATNAFALYDEILTTSQQHIQRGDLILLALGHTATVLAADLNAIGHQAIDVGHVDVEYEWYRMGAKGKVAIPNKYVNEVRSGRIEAVSEIDQQYNAQIVAHLKHNKKGTE